MTLLTALDDFLLRTLAVLPGVFSKLEYVSALRDPEGHYAHWGLERVYGKIASERAIGEAHRELALNLLRTPVKDLMGEAACSAAERQLALDSYLEQLSRAQSSLLPAEIGGGSVRHFSSVLTTLSVLARAGRDASRPAS